jgi:UDP-GlcNAc:undecaprenyl-phosphate GlcNAc-1-phosphate transferase
VLFVAMSVAVAVGFRVGAERFRVTPMDFLVILIALVVPNVPELHMKVQHLGVATAMIIVLLYSIELVLNNVWRRWDVMRFTTYVTLAVLGVRGLAGA